MLSTLCSIFPFIVLPVMQPQSAILDAIPDHARHLFFGLDPSDDPRAALRALATACDGKLAVLGIGVKVAGKLGVDLAGLRGHALQAMAAPAFTQVQAIDSFRYRDSRDLTGYEDGTENPKDEAAAEAAIAQGQGRGIDGSSFAAVQQWLHGFPVFDALPRAQQNNCFGRDRDSNEELGDAPESAHVKRTAQEDFDPEAFVVRRSMPWVAGADAGLLFLAFGKSFNAFEAQLRRMTGHDDGISDALFHFTRPLTGGYYWCPPMAGNEVDLSALDV
mgnify:CR=1 FL=1